MFPMAILVSTVLCALQGVSAFGIVGNPLAFGRPCKGNDDVTASFEAGLPPGEENQYNLNVKRKISSHSQVNLKFDSAASLTLSDKTKARLTAEAHLGTFHLRYFKNASYINLQVKGPATGTIPYIQSIQVNGDEICEEPDTGYFDNLILGYRDTAQIASVVPDESCGRRKVEHTALIVNGEDTKPGDWPWHVAVFRLEGAVLKYICGGTLLSKTLVLTAAHCTTIRGVPVLPDSLSVVLGKHNLIGGDIASQEREVFEVIVHSEFDPRSLDNDISLLKLKSEAVFDDYVQPACLWSAASYKKLRTKGVRGTVVGWGFSNKNQLSPALKQATMPKISEATCLKSNPLFYARVLNQFKFCAGYTNGTSACNGDSGGGFTVFVPDTPGDGSKNAPGAWHVRGIVSNSVSRRDAPICDPTQYVVFTDLAKYRGWITNYI